MSASSVTVCSGCTLRLCKTGSMFSTTGPLHSPLLNSKFAFGELAEPRSSKEFSSALAAPRIYTRFGSGSSDELPSNLIPPIATEVVPEIVPFTFNVCERPRINVPPPTKSPTVTESKSLLSDSFAPSEIDICAVSGK